MSRRISYALQVDEIFVRKKMDLHGTSMDGRFEYWTIAKVSIRYDRITDQCWCTCKSCSVTQIPNHGQPRCVYVGALRKFRKLMVESLKPKTFSTKDGVKNKKGDCNSKENNIK